MPADRSSLRLLVVLQAVNFDRVFECALRELLERGHEIHLAYGGKKRILPAGAGLVVEALRRDYPDSFSDEELPPWRSSWEALGAQLRLAGDYLRYLEPRFASADALRERARMRASRLLRGPVAAALLRADVVRAAVAWALRALEAAVPPPPEIVEYLRRHDPDALVVSPLVGLGSSQVDWLRGARSLGIPPVHLVASWDNLTNKGLVRGDPSLVVVWNDRQVAEAVELHGIPADRVVAVGAHSFDHWFTWQPSTSFPEFAEKVGLDPGRPFLLYVGSSSFISGDESAFASEWIRRLRESDSDRLREVGVLVRPHPQSIATWDGFDAEEPGRVVVWPRAGAAPTDERRKADYYDSLYHSSGVVGINTSALVESAIVGRPVFTLADGRFRETQEGTLHFAHLTGADGDGVLIVGRSWEEHLAQLDAALAEPGLHAARLETFVREFVRPRGVDEPAAPKLAAAFETVPRRAVDPLPRAFVRRLALQPVRLALEAAARASRGRRRARKHRVGIMLRLRSELRTRLGSGPGDEPVDSRAVEGAER